MNKFLKISGILLAIYTGFACNNFFSSAPYRADHVPGQNTPTLTAPATPAGITVSPGDTEVTLSWSGATGADSYNIYWSTDVGVTPANGTKISSTTLSYTQTGLTDGTTYYYVVTSVNSSGESPASAVVSATPIPLIPGVPAGVSITAGNSQNTISWNAVANASSYNVYYKTISGVTKANGTKIASNITPTAYVHSSLTFGNTYYYVVTAVNIAGESAESAEVGAAPNCTVVVSAGSSNCTMNLAGNVTTVNGAGASYSNGGIYASLSTPTNGVISGSNMYLTDTGRHRIVKVDLNTGATTNFAGIVNSAGYMDGPGNAALFSSPNAIATDGTNLYVTDTGNQAIRKISLATGAVTTLADSAGCVGACWGFVDATGWNARFSSPLGLTTDGTNLYVADSGNHAIRKVVIASGVVTTIAGGAVGYLDGTGPAPATLFSSPYGITIDGTNTNLYVTDSNNQRIRKVVIATGATSTVAGGNSTGAGYCCGAVPNGYLNDATGTLTPGVGTAAAFWTPTGISTDGINLYVSDQYNQVIRKVVISTGVTTTIAGTPPTIVPAVSYTINPGFVDSTGLTAKFSSPMGTVLSGNNLYVFDQNTTVRKVDITSTAVTTFIGISQFNNPQGITTDGTNLYVADANNHVIRKIVIASGLTTVLAGTAPTWAPGYTTYPGFADGALNTARFNDPRGITTDGTNLYVADNVNHVIRKIVIATGATTTLAGMLPTSCGAGCWTTYPGFQDGIGAAAKFYNPQGITTDGANLYVADFSNHAIRKIVIATGAVTTIAGSPPPAVVGTSGFFDTITGPGFLARFNGPTDVITDGTNLFVVDFSNQAIRKIVLATGATTTFAGAIPTAMAGYYDGIGNSARFNNPTGLTTDGTNLFVADKNNHLIRKIVISTGLVSTLAGYPTNPANVDGLTYNARFSLPSYITTDGLSLYVADSGNHAIRKIE